MGRRPMVLAVLIALAAGVAACGGEDEETAATGDGQTQQQEVQEVELMLSYQRSIAFVGEIMAQENGYFAEEGLKVEPIPSEGGAFVTQQMAAGNRPYGLAGAQNIIIAASQGRALQGIWEHDRDIILIGTPTDSGVASIEDLRGKALGITDPGGGEVSLVNAVLEDAGIKDEVETPAVGPGGPSVLQALKSGRIAAYAGYTNDLAGVEAVGMELDNILPDKFRGLPSNLLALSQDAAGNELDRDTLIKIARAWTRGIVDALNDPEHALEVACEYVPEECQDEAVARAYMNVTLEGIKPREGLQLGEFDYPSLEVQLELLSQRDLGPEEVDLEETFTNDYIGEINDFDSPQLEPGAPKLLDVGGSLAD